MVPHFPGWFLFPCRPDAKEPLVRWRDESTNDPEKLAAFDLQFPGCNWGVDCFKSNLFVIDVDPGGADTLFELELDHGQLPPTLRHSTPRGGEHILYAGPGPTSAGRLGKGLDTRGAGGFILLPGSTVGGKLYSVVSDLPIAAPPTWIISKLGEKRERATSEIEARDEHAGADSETALARGRHYLDAQPGVQQGERGSTAYRHAARLRDFGISYPKGLDLLEPWNNRCEPPQEFDALEAAVAHAYKYAQNEAGSKAGRPLSDVYADVVRARHGEALPGRNGEVSQVPPPPNPRPWRILDEAAQDALAEPAWIINGHVPQNSLGAIIGTPEAYKSFAALDLALGVASAVPWLGSLAIARQGATIFCAGEGAINMARRRRPAWREARGIREPIPFICFDAVPLIYSEQVSWFIEDVVKLGVKPVLIVFDTLSRMMGGLDENNAKDMGIAIEQADRVRRETGASVLFVAHSGKDPSKGLRGSSAGMAAFDWAIRADADHETLTVKLSCAKMKDAEHFAPIYALGKATRLSLVFTRIPASQHAALTGAREAMPAHMVEDALKHLGPGEHSTRVLADTLNAALEISLDNERERRTTMDLLRMGAHDKLRPYATKNGARQGAPLLWSLPASDD